MDKVYGRQAADILACNTLAVIQKIKKIGGGIGILLNENALKECNLDKNYLLRKLAENGIKNFTIEEKRNIMVNVPIQPI